MKKLTRYFLQGLLIIAPLTITVYAVITVVVLVGSVFNAMGLKVHEYVDHLLGFVSVIGLTVFIGFLSKSLFMRPVFASIENLATSTPLIKIIYTALKDLFNSFLSDKKKFDKPVLVDINKDIGLQKLGFLTREDLSELGLKDKVAVYLPHSYAWSGNFFVIDADRVHPIDRSATDVMKFIVSGGATELTHSNSSDDDDIQHDNTQTSQNQNT